MMLPKISIIVPIYNVERYLRRCIESIINQTYKNLEIILVDDGSPDNCGKICDMYSEQDERIKVIHQENKGLSEARNAGLNIATGDFLGFVDSDDYIEPDMYEVLYNALEKHQADISMCNCFWSDAVGYKNADVCEVREGLEALQFAYRNTYGEDAKFMIMVVWSKLYKKEIFENIRFSSKYHMGEDVAVLAEIFEQAGKSVYVHRNLYHYWVNEASIVHSKWKHEKISAAWTFDLFLSKIKGKISKTEFERWSELFAEMMVRKMKDINDCNLSKQEKRKYVNEIVGYIRKNKKRGVRNFTTRENWIKFNLVLILKHSYIPVMEKCSRKYTLWCTTEKS